MTGDLLKAAEAERIGLVNHVVPAAECLDRAVAFARRLAEGPILAIKWTKVSVNKMLRASVNLVLDASLALEMLGMTGPEVREGIAALREKRKPDYPRTKGF